jgi:hypothetical protein
LTSNLSEYLTFQFSYLLRSQRSIFHRLQSLESHFQRGSAGLNFINVLCTAFTLVDPKSVKKDTDDLTVFFTLLGSTSAKAVRSTLMKLTPVQAQNNTARYIYLSSVRIRKPVVNFINILRAHFSYESKLSSFSIVMFQFLYFWRQNISAKCACKMLMKLTPKVDFTNILQEAFYPNFLTPKNYKYKL